MINLRKVKWKRILFSFLLATYPLIWSPFLTHQHLPKILWSSLLLSAVLFFKKNGEGKIYLTAGFFLWLGYMAFLTRSLFLNNVGFVGVWSLGYGILILVLHFVSGNISLGLRDVALIYIFPAFIVSCYGIIESFPVQTLHTYLTNVSTLGSVNHAASFLISVIPLIAAFIIIPHKRPIRERLVGIVVLFYCILYLFLTGCRGAWLGLAVGSTAALVIGLLKTRDKLRALLIGFSIIIFCLFPLAFSQMRSFVLDRIYSVFDLKVPSNQFRILTWYGTVRMIAQSPWTGVGPGKFAYMFPCYRDPDEYLISKGRFVSDPHNEYLLVAVEGGLLALILFIAWILASLIGAFITSWKDKGDDGILALGVLGSLLAVACHALVSNSFTSPASGITFAVLGAITARKIVRKYPGWLRFSMICVSLSIVFIFSCFLVADIYLARGQKELFNDQEKASLLFKKAVVWNPYNHTHNQELGRAYLAIKNYIDAYEAFKASLSIFPYSHTSLVDIGLCELGMGKIKEAREVWERAVKIYPNSAVLRKNLGQLLFDIKDQTAYIHLCRAFQIDNSLASKPDFLLVLGKAALMTRAPESAKNSFEMALKLQKDSLPARIGLGNAYELLGDSNHAMRQYVEASREYPKEALPRLSMGVLLARLGEFEAASTHLLEAASLGDKDERYRAFFHLGEIFSLERKPETAVLFFKQAIKFYPESYPANMNLGIILFDLRRLDEAANAFLTAAKLSPNVYHPYIYLARIKAIQENQDEAIGYILKAVDLGLCDMNMIEQDPFLNQVCKHPLYPQIIQKVKSKDESK